MAEHRRSERGSRGGLRGRWKAVLSGAGIAAAVAVGGCGADDATSEPRPPAAIEVTARVSDDRVTVSPERFGAGLVVLTFDNQSSEPIQPAIEGPTAVTGRVIEPGQPGILKTSFERGEYEVSAGEDSSARPAEVTVEAERASSQNELLLP